MVSDPMEVGSMPVASSLCLAGVGNLSSAEDHVGIYTSFSGHTGLAT